MTDQREKTDDRKTGPALAARDRSDASDEPTEPPRPSLDSERRREILQQLFFEGAARWPYLRQFYTLLMLSTIIATAGRPPGRIRRG